MRVLVIGLDCLGAEALRMPIATHLPNIQSIARSGISGALQSTLPPITVPAWTSMFTGKDPGELGIYGFRNRRSFRYGDTFYAGSQSVRYPRIWDRLSALDRPSIVVGVPQTSPPPSAFCGMLISGFEGPTGANEPWTYPHQLGREIESRFGPYQFDIPEFRHQSLDAVNVAAHHMTQQRFSVFRHLLAANDWDLAVLHEIGPDRMHHCFWKYHDPQHPLYDGNSVYSNAIVDYYAMLDQCVGQLLNDIDRENTAVVIASDHGATAMKGVLHINNLLIENGLLVLRESISHSVPLEPSMVDWQKTCAWAEGGYYGRIYLNLEGREPMGSVSHSDHRSVIARIKEALGTVQLECGRVLNNQVSEPSAIYRAVRGIPPDLLFFSEADQWRCVSSVGGNRRSSLENDLGPDGANHASLGMYAIAVPGIDAHRTPDTMSASILDIAPTLSWILGIDDGTCFSGVNLLASAMTGGTAHD